MHFTYVEDLNRRDLGQGDIVRPVGRLKNILERVHPLCLSDKTIAGFLVLTQTCDLVLRAQRNGKIGCAARWISLAPVRRLQSFLETRLGEYATDYITKALGGNTERPIVRSARVKLDMDRFLERVFNNNEDGLFYLERAPECDFPHDCCADLAFPITLAAEEAHAACLEGKALQLNEEFRAKLGWMVGKIYSRVGTRDWPASELRQKIDNLLTGAAVWVPDRKFDRLKRSIKRKLKENPEFALSEHDLLDKIGRLPSKREVVLSEIVAMAKEFIAEADKLEGFRRSVESSTVIQTELKE